MEMVDGKPGEFREKHSPLVEVFLAAYPRLCREAAGQLPPTAPFEIVLSPSLIPAPRWALNNRFGTGLAGG
jgi:hypothetical protein